MHTKRLFIPAFGPVNSTTAQLGEGDMGEGEEEGDDDEEGGELRSFETRFG